MIHANFASNWPSGFREDVYESLRFSVKFSIFSNGGGYV